jgi:hypothetical protein
VGLVFACGFRLFYRKPQAKDERLYLCRHGNLFSLDRCLPGAAAISKTITAEVNCALNLIA